MITVAKSTPQASEMAMGIMNAVAGLSVSINGNSPAKVVVEVMRMGRKRTMPERCTASSTSTPARRCRLM